MTVAERPLRVAFFGHAEGRRGDGLSTYSRELVHALRDEGVDLRFFAHRADGELVPVESRDALLLRAWHLRTVTIPRPGSVRSIRTALADFAPDVVHISWSFSLHDGVIARLGHQVGAVTVATFHLPHGPAGTARGRVLNGLYRYHRLQMRNVDRCIALSWGQRALLVRAGYEARRITVIANGVDTTAISPGPSRLHHELGARLVVLYIGRLDPEKRVPALVESFLSLRLPSDHVLCIAGDGVQRDRLRRLAAGRANVRLLGLVGADRVLELLRGCDVFVLPSTTEGLALSLLEAMAAGCAIVATDAGEDGTALDQAGLVISTHPLRPALDTAVARLLFDEPLRRRLGEAARDRATTEYSMSRSAQRVLAVYAAASSRVATAPTTPTPVALP
ncbi:MAG: glycosyltransferase family 4 protein [Candidatus Dormibacteraeota bacterium]|uniref:Glycosyltransferase family 4 protein n=1 Tax=Candidatus Amunia macphersoniae TaxID=3127014 RepID=A0A934NJE4_9BACT|nr:glycosyltransferase family 4 protein [Candidatus Dormibacteraeota bacterium]